MYVYISMCHVCVYVSDGILVFNSQFSLLLIIEKLGVAKLTRLLNIFVPQYLLINNYNMTMREHFPDGRSQSAKPRRHAS